jgi:hypothetical protein
VFPTDTLHAFFVSSPYMLHALLISSSFTSSFDHISRKEVFHYAVYFKLLHISDKLLEKLTVALQVNNYTGFMESKLNHCYHRISPLDRNMNNVNPVCIFRRLLL